MVRGAMLAIQVLIALGLILSGCASTQIDMAAWSTRDLTALPLRNQSPAMLNADRTECVAQTARLPRIDLYTVFIGGVLGDELSKRVRFTDCMTAKGYAVHALPLESAPPDPALIDRAHGR